MAGTFSDTPFPLFCISCIFFLSRPETKPLPGDGISYRLQRRLGANITQGVGFGNAGDDYRHPQFIAHVVVKHNTGKLLSGAIGHRLRNHLLNFIYFRQKPCFRRGK